MELLLEQIRAGDQLARNTLYELTFARLRAIAASLLRRERRGHSFQPTALVGELFLKLRGSERLIASEDHFYGLAARAMKQVLIDHARKGRALKKVRPEDVPALLANRDAAHNETRLSVMAVFRKLQQHNAMIASTVWLRSVEGLTLAEVSQRQGRAVWLVRADFDFGVSWMSRRIRPWHPQA